MTFGFLRAEFRSLTKDDILRDCGGNSLNNYGRLAVIDSQGCSISLVSYND